VLYQAHQLAASNSLRRPVVGTKPGTKPWAAPAFGNVIDFVRFRRETDDELDRLEVTA